jgi:hypothetical protein
VASVTEKSIFYHVPKTGGIWVSQAIRASGIKLGRAERIKANIPLTRTHSIPELIQPEIKEGRFSFCFVRYPIDWYKSFWCYRIRTRTIDLRFPADLCWSNDYDEFVNNLLLQYPTGFVTNLYQCYVGRELNGVDFIGKQETLADDLVTALNLSGEDFDEEKLRATRVVNASGTRPKLERLAVLQDETRERVNEVEKWVLENFYTT